MWWPSRSSRWWPTDRLPDLRFRTPSGSTAYGFGSVPARSELSTGPEGPRWRVGCLDKASPDRSPLPTAMPPTELTETTPDAEEDDAPRGARQRSGAPAKLVIVESPAKAKTIAGMLGPDYVVESSIGHIRDLATRKELPSRLQAGVVGRPGRRRRQRVQAGVHRVAREEVPGGQVEATGPRGRRGLPGDGRGPRGRVDRLAPEPGPGPPRGHPPDGVPRDHAPGHPAGHRGVPDHRPPSGRGPGGPPHLRPHLRLQAVRRHAPQDQRAIGRACPERGHPDGRRPGAGAHGVPLGRLVGDRRHGHAPKARPPWPPSPTCRRSFAAALVAVDGTPLAGGKDFDSSGRLADPDKVVVLDESAARALAAGLEGAPLTVSSMTHKPYRRSPTGAVHHLDAAAGGGAQAAVQLEADHVGGPAPLRGGLDHLHADRLDDAVGPGPVRRPGPGHGHVRPGVRAASAPRLYNKKVKNAQEAHEAIRPAGETFRTPDEAARSLSGDEFRLYDLIWKRTVASQMADATGTSAQVRLTGTATVDGAARTVEFGASGTVIEFPGFQRAYVEGEDDPEAELADREVHLPPMAEGDPAALSAVEPGGHATQPPARYTEASLVKAMEEIGVGRPSTYASIVSTILDRGYVWKKGSAMVPSLTAFGVVGLLEQHFADLVDYGLTASMEDDLDEIAGGDEDMVRWLGDFWFGPDGHGGLRDQLAENLDAIDAAAVNAVPIGTASGRPGDRGPVGQVRPVPEEGRGDGLHPRGSRPRRTDRREGRGAAGRAVVGPRARHRSRDRPRGPGQGRALRPLRPARRAGRRRPQAPHLVAVRLDVAGHPHVRTGTRAAAHPPGGRHRSRPTARRSWPSTASSVPT